MKAWACVSPKTSSRGRVICVGPALERTIFAELCEVYETVEQAIAALEAA